MSRVFPVTVQTDVGQSITLYADGTSTGSPQLLELWLTNLDRGDAPPDVGTIATVMFWLLLRAMQDDKRIGRAPRA